MVDTYRPTEAMAAAARRAKKMREGQPPSNRGMTSVGLTRMNQLINREPLSLETVRRMFSFFSRHEVDKRSDSWKEGNSKAEQAWLGWGGDPGFTWSRRIVERADTNDAENSKVAKVMREFEAGTLRSSSGELVTSKEQALAIALSEARQ